MSLRARVCTSLAVASVTLTLASLASAQESSTTVNGQSLTHNTNADAPADRFGEKRQLAISSDAALTISNTSVSGATGSTTTIQLQPAVDYFVIRNLSVGGSILLQHQSSGGSSSTSFGIGPRVGYNFPLSDLISIWPKAGLSIAHTSVSPPDPLPSASNTAVALNLFVPFMLHPVPHFFAGFGPFLDTDLSGTNKATTIGGKLTIGGWFGT